MLGLLQSTLLHFVPVGSQTARSPTVLLDALTRVVFCFCFFKKKPFLFGKARVKIGIKNFGGGQRQKKR